MRRFNKREQCIIKNLIKGFGSSLQYLPINAFDYIFQSNNIEMHPQNPDELIFYFKNQCSIDLDKIISISKELIEIAVLIQYLQQEGLILNYNIGTTKNLNNSIAYQHNKYTFPLSVKIPSDIGITLLSCNTNPIFIVENLKELVNNNFKTFEDLSLEESRKQTENSFKAVRLSLVSIVISLITLLLTFLNSILSNI